MRPWGWLEHLLRRIGSGWTLHWPNTWLTAVRDCSSKQRYRRMLVARRSRLRVREKRRARGTCANCSAELARWLYSKKEKIRSLTFGKYFGSLPREPFLCPDASFWCCLLLISKQLPIVQDPHIVQHGGWLVQTHVLYGQHFSTRAWGLWSSDSAEINCPTVCLSTLDAKRQTNHWPALRSSYSTDRDS